MVEFNSPIPELNSQMPNDSESVKLVKNTKGFNWEIKLKEDLLSDATLERLKDLNNKLDKEYGNRD
jgi:hypothetical protein